MSATTAREGIIDRIRRDGRTVEALGIVLGRSVNGAKTTAIPCLDPSHADRHASAVIEPTNGRVTCKGCGRSWGLLELGVLAGLGADAAGVAPRLEERLYGTTPPRGGSTLSAHASRAPGTETPSWHRNPPPPRLDPGVLVPVPPEGGRGNGTPDPVTREFPFVPEQVVASLHWKLVQHRGRQVLKAAIFDGALTVCGVKVRGPRRPGGDHDAFLEKTRTGRREKGLLRGEILRDVDPGRLVLVLAGETDLLTLQEAALREGTQVLAVSPSNGEGQCLLDVAEAFRGHRVVLVYDADAAGRKGALDRAWELRTAAEATAALALPFTDEQAAGGMKDLRDWLGAGGTAAGLVERALAALDGEGVVVDEAAKPLLSPKPAASSAVPPWQPFPVEVLPAPLADLVTEGAMAIGCDPSFIVLPLLAVVGAAVGNSRTAELKKGWEEPPVVWAASVGESGSHKSPAQDVALAPLRQMDEEAQIEHEEDRRVWKAERQRHEVLLGEWKRGGAVGDPPEEPEFPKARRYVVCDATVEATSKLLSDNPRGLLLARDELAGWLRSFDAYRAGKGGDASFYLATHGARQHLVDRKGGDTPSIHVSRAALSITGGIQPGTLALCIGKEHAEDGLLARLLFALPPRTAPRWTTAVIGDGTRAHYAEVVADLAKLQLVPDRKGIPGPVALPLSKEGLAVWAPFYDRFGEKQAAAVGMEASALAKLVSYAARFALIHQLVRDPGAREIDAEAVRSGARLSAWFAEEAVRVHAVLVESPEDAARRRLVEWVEVRGGRTTVRELSHGPREYRQKEVAEGALSALVAAGLGAWEERKGGAKGGRPTRVFVLRRRPVEEVSDEAASPPSPHAPPPGTGTKTPDSSLEGGGFRCQEGVLVPPAKENTSAVPVHDAAPAGTPEAPAPVTCIDLAEIPDEWGDAADPALLGDDLDLAAFLGTAGGRTA